jgi:1-phosphatidylinositol-3-phosphate 5-kinase
MARIARHTGAPMLDSVDMLSHDSDNFFGRCGRFYLRSYAISAAEHSAERAGDSVYMFVEGCPPERGVTLLLRGASKSTLRALKSIATRAVVRARHLRFETSLLRDVGAWASARRAVR